MSINFGRAILRAGLAACAALSLAAAAPSPGRAQPGEIVDSLKSPCNYPSGLAWDGKWFYVADWRNSRICQIDDRGDLRESKAAPTLRPSGLVYAPEVGKLFVSDNHSGGIFAWDFAGGDVAWTFQAPGSQAAGLAWGDGALFILERSTKTIYKVNPQDGTILWVVPTPEPTCEHMAYDGRYLWIADRTKDEIYMMDDTTGKVIGVLDAPGHYAAGLAWVGGYLWNADFQERQIYKLAITGGAPYRVFHDRVARIEYYWALNNYGPGTITGGTLGVAIPQKLPNQELLSEPEFSRKPTREAVDRWGQPCAIFDLGATKPGENAVVSYSVNARVSAIRYLIIPENTGSLSDIPRDIRQKYLADGARYRIASPYIKDTVKKIVGGEKNPYWIMRKIYDFVIDHLEYEMAGGWDIPEVVLNRGKGSCSEYTFSFVALCRAAGLPARYQGSIVVRGDDACIDEAFHRWAQVYLPNYGWIPVDANRGDSPSPVGQAKGIGELADRFLITTHSGGDSEYLQWGYNSQVSYRTDGYCKVEEDNYGFWEPLKKESLQVER